VFQACVYFFVDLGVDVLANMETKDNVVRLDPRLRGDDKKGSGDDKKGGGDDDSRSLNNPAYNPIMPEQRVNAGFSATKLNK
jgi:hypothetical protein